MSKLTRLGLLPLFLLALAFSAPTLAAQDENGEGSGFQPSPDDPITVDFVRKDIHTVMHYIALRSGLQVIVQGDISVVLTVMFRKVNPKEAIQSICKANKLDMVEDGLVIIIKQRPQDILQANVVKGTVDPENRYNVNFEAHELQAAISEVARVTGAQIFMPSVPPSEGGAPRDPEEEGEGTERVMDIQQRKISMHMREALPVQILNRLADLGDLKIEPVTLEDSVEGSETGYRFTYKPVKKIGIEGGGVVGPSPDDIKLVSQSWVVPGANTSSLKSNLADILSPYGKVVHDDTTDYVMVYEEEERMKLIASFMDAVVQRTTDMELEADENADNYLVREYRLIRDTEPGEFLSAIQGLVSENGRVVVNPDRNSVIVYELESRMASIDEIMAAMDTAPEQVLITAKLVEVTLDEYMGYGLEVFTSHSADNLNNGRFTGGSFDTTQGSVGGLFGQPTGFDPFFATFSNPRIDVRLELLANEGRVKTLSQPTQMVSNRQTANIVVGQEIPFLESSSATGGSTTASVAFKEVSIRMDVTPTVLESGLVRLEVSVVVSEVIGNVAIEGNNTPVLSTRESTTDVFIRDGETLVMGGLMRERDRYDENGLPFLKDIPFLGYLFKSANRTTSKTDLLFFLRPQIVNANGPQVTMANADIERDLRPLTYEDGDAEKADIRDSRHRRLGVAPKPSHYNPQSRPKTAKDVKPGA